MYLTDIFGKEISLRAWNEASSLPYFLSDGYSYRKAEMSGIQWLFVSPKDESINLPRLKKHLVRIAEIACLPVALDMTYIDARRRKALLAAKIPFVAENSQIFLPFLGTMFQERHLASASRAERLTPSAQLVLFALLHTGEKTLYYSDPQPARSLSYWTELPPMQLSRAVRQLCALGWTESEKEGVRVSIFRKEKRKTLYENAQPFLINPVKKKVFVEKKEIEKQNVKVFIAGQSALSELTMLASPEAPVFAFHGKNQFVSSTETLENVDTQVELEIWNYSPGALSSPSHKNQADILSVIASFKGNDDPRIEQALGEALEQFREEKQWSRD